MWPGEQPEVSPCRKEHLGIHLLKTTRMLTFGDKKPKGSCGGRETRSALLGARLPASAMSKGSSPHPQTLGRRCRVGATRAANSHRCHPWMGVKVNRFLY